MLDLADVGQLYDLDRPDLKYDPWVPLHAAPPRGAAKDGDLFAEIARRDVIVHHPYDSFGTSVEAFVRAAANDANVVTVKTTVYRTSEDSALAPALIEAAENGKQSVCVVELKARFDERRNIELGALARAGGRACRLRLPGHEDPREDDARRPRARATGCGATSTSGPATTTRPRRGSTRTSACSPPTRRSRADIADLFNFVTGFGRPQRFRKILVAPFNLRRRSWSSEIRAGRPRLRRPASTPGSGSRCNNLTRPEVIVEELYRASQAGAEIDLIVRAVCVAASRASRG